MKKQTSIHAQCAKAIRQELAKAFPETTFKVTSSSFAGGNSVDTRWNNGPTENQVYDLIGKYQYGSFDSMQDLYEHSNNRNDIPQVRFVQTCRDISKDLVQTIFECMKPKYEGWKDLNDMHENSLVFKDYWSFWCAYDYIMHRILRDADLTCGIDKILAEI